MAAAVIQRVPILVPVKAKPFSPKSHKMPKTRPSTEGHAFPEWTGPESAGQTVSGGIAPADLHKILEVSPYVRMTFPSEKKLMNYRHNLYKVNVEGKFRYSTRREGWSSLIIMRLK